MANRTMQAKRLKMQRMKRTYPKWLKMSCKNDRNKVQAYGDFNNRGTAVIKTSSGGIPDQDNTFMQEVPRTHSLSSYDMEEKVWVRSPRYEVVQKGLHAELDETALREQKSFVADALMKTWQNEFHQGVTVYHSLIVENKGNYKLVMHFSGSEFVFVQEIAPLRWMSATYTSREEAWSRYQAGTIAWISKTTTEKT